MHLVALLPYCATVPGRDRIYNAKSRIYIQMVDDNIILVGTGHILEKSVREVEAVIERENPDIVAVELCPSRYEVLRGGVTDFSVKDAIAGGKPFLMLTHWLLAYVQRKMGNELGIEPGAEMLAAINKAEELGCRVALIDRPIQITMLRFWKKMRFIEKLKMLFSIILAIANIGSFGGKVKGIDLNSLTNEDVVTKLIEELREFSPGAATTLLDERDAYIAGSLLALKGDGPDTDKKIVAVVGAGHVAGIKRLLNHPELIPPREELCRVPDSGRLSIKNLFGIGLGVVVAILAVAILLSGLSLDILIRALFWWFIINGSLSALGVLIARGHPFSALIAFSVAWLTSLNPFLAAGWFAGLIEAKLRKPSGEDVRGMMKVDSLRQLMRNKVFKVIFVAALANAGSMIGTFLGAYVVLHVVGLDVSQLWQGLSRVI